MVRDAHGRKMSKSLGNVIDPVDVIQGITLKALQKSLEGGNLDPKEVKKAQDGQALDYPNGIPECGTDALRFALCAYTSQGRDINLDVLRIQGYRFFCNKLWNATKFAMMYLGADFKPETGLIAALIKKKAIGKASEEPAEMHHRPLPPADQMLTPGTMRTLDACLRVSPFLSASHPTQVDVVAFEAYRQSPPPYFVYRSLSGWFHRVNAMTAEERKALPGGAGVLTPKPASLTHMDRWILSRLSHAVSLCNEGFSEYNFPQVTTAVYNFWLYELCDVYLEYLKPVFQSGDPATALTARNVLYECLDAGLRLISPMMPFISEELFQRLPRRSDAEPPSIMVTKYPEEKEYPFRDKSKVEAQVELVQKVISVVRSTRADYNLPNKSKTELHLRAFDQMTANELKDYSSVIGTLAYCSTVQIVTGQAPTSGCAVVPVSDRCSAHLGLRGLIDARKEEDRLIKKRATLTAQSEKLKKAMAVKGYEAKVPEEVRQANTEKLSQTDTEIERLGDAIAALKEL
jgi:valyl-tRNA synthetase